MCWRFVDEEEIFLEREEITFIGSQRTLNAKLEYCAAGDLTYLQSTLSSRSLESPRRGDLLSGQVTEGFRQIRVDGISFHRGDLFHSRIVLELVGDIWGRLEVRIGQDSLTYGTLTLLFYLHDDVRVDSLTLSNGRIQTDYEYNTRSILENVSLSSEEAYRSWELEEADDGGVLDLVVERLAMHLQERTKHLNVITTSGKIVKSGQERMALPWHQNRNLLEAENTLARGRGRVSSLEDVGDEDTSQVLLFLVLVVVGPILIRPCGRKEEFHFYERLGVSLCSSIILSKRKNTFSNTIPGGIS